MDEGWNLLHHQYLTKWERLVENGIHKVQKNQISSKNKFTMFQVCLPETQEQSNKDLLGEMDTTDYTNKNLGEYKKDILRWHYRLGHIEFAHLR